MTDLGLFAIFGIKGIIMQKVNNNLSDKAIRGFGSQSAITIGVGAVNLIYFSIMSRLLDKEDFGYFAIIIAITSILNEISSAGLGSAIIQKKDLEKDFFHCAFTLSILIGMVFSLLLLLSSSELSKWYIGGTSLTVGFKIISITFLLHNIISPIRALYIRDMQFFKYGCCQLATLFFSYGIGVALAYNGIGFLSVVIASSLTSLSLAILLLILNHRELEFQLNKTYVSEIVSYGGWLTASGLIRSVYEQLDKLITSKWISVYLLGAYNRPVGFITQVSGQLNGIFDTVLFPLLSTSQDNKLKMRKAYLVCTELVFVPALILAFGFTICSHLLISIFLGDKWLDLIPVFKIASISMVFMFYNRIGDCFFRSLGIVKEYFFIRVVICGLSAVCIYVGCKYGIYGLTISVLIIKFVESFVKTLFFKYRLGFSFVEFIHSISIVSILPVSLFVCTLFIQYNYNTSLNDILALLFFFGGMIIVVKLHPCAMGLNLNNYILKKYLNRWM